MKWFATIIGLAFVSSSAATKPVAASRASSAVWPRAAATLVPIPLSDLIWKAIPSQSTMSWEHLLIANVRWITDGIEYHSANGAAYRQGLARVRAAGQTATVLRQRVEELAWIVELSTENNEKWGPTLIIIRPGLTGEQENGKYICFGTGFSGCDFPIGAIRHAKIRYKQECRIGSGGGQSTVLSAVTADGRRGTVVYQGSGGSGGYSNGIEVTTLSPAAYCTKNKDRGY